MSGEGWVAVLALAVSVATLLWSLRSSRANAEHSALNANMSSLVGVWSQLGNKPSVLRFHGITDADLLQAGVDAHELAYLIASFETANVYYRYFERDTGPFAKGSIRYQMCASEATRKAWPLLKQFFAGESSYFTKIEATMKLFEQRRP